MQNKKLLSLFKTRMEQIWENKTLEIEEGAILLEMQF